MDVPDSRGSAQVGAALEASHYEHLLNEVEATEGQLGAILRSVVCPAIIFPVQVYCYSNTCCVFDSLYTVLNSMC